ncbi:MAG: L-histidine N(alpha)-methyltransferase [Gammaproteobacteria bacterium]|nr:L-histidine N(alpha)-methyltransferase [Gammaproteobacteria bacterium]MBU1646019.1 L-histidine N(alpha)-methyltransferase [Gammaproteobacteria bacterium]MBU1972081.1 L-histidine N(alpha)-methyltransferase [Gammaproteobacteria bacterium]
MQPRLIQVDRADPSASRDELLRGLQADPAAIPPKYFYDALGARLFAAITELPEYYPTRTEAAIFARHAEAMARLLPAFAALVDLGAGNCEKAARLFAAFGVRRYVAVDISVDYLRESLDVLRHQHPRLDLLGVGLDFSSRLDLPAAVGEGPRLLFYPGSSIGNFAPADALAFLRQARAAAQGGALLIGVDLVKPVDVLEAAYDDPLGVTAAFNRNLLRHVRRVASADFSLTDWRHVAFFNDAESRIEMHLEAVRDVAVRWPGGARRFAAGARIHTENSYKWRLADFAALLDSAGFGDLHHWTDDNDWFAVFLARA